MKVQNKKVFGIVSKLFLLAAVFVLEAVLIGQLSITANAQGTATVVADSGKIRKSADTGSEVLGSVAKDDKLSVIAQTTAADGYTWYKVHVDDSTTGYIRADLVSEVEGSIDTESSSEASASSQNDTSTAAPQEQTAQDVEFVQVSETTVTAAKVIADSVNVRSNPSTNATAAGKAKEGTEVSVFGEATDTEGKVWYQVKFTSDDKTIEGFIRSDFLEVTANEEAEEPVEPVEEEPVEEEPEEVSTNKEYELVFEANPEGVEEWFLYDHTRGTKQSLADLLAVVRQTQEDENSAVSQLKTFKILVIVMIAIILALIIGVTLLVFKLRDVEYEYEDDEDDEDDEDEDDMEDEDDDDEEDDEDDEPVVKKPLLKKSAPAAKASQPARTKSAETPAKAATPAPKKEASSSWQSKNFLDIDDDMEFEFLDIK